MKNTFEFINPAVILNATEQRYPFMLPWIQQALHEHLLVCQQIIWSTRGCSILGPRHSNSFSGATSSVADSEIFLGDFIMSENSLNVATTVATKQEHNTYTLPESNPEDERGGGPRPSPLGTHNLHVGFPIGSKVQKSFLKQTNERALGQKNKVRIKPIQNN